MKINWKTKHLDKGWNAKVAEWKAMPKSTDLEVGIFGNREALNRAIFNEYGTATAEPRPFMRPTLVKKQGMIANETRNVAKEMAYGDGRKAERRINNLGANMVMAIRETIDDFVPPPNAESTKKKKGSEWPLIESQEMYNSISHRVSKTKTKK